MTADAWRLAFGTFTVLPVAPPRQVTTSVAARAMLLAPVTATPAAVVLVVGHLAAASGTMPSLLVASLVLVAHALLSRGLHLDGLADTVDGLTSSFDRDRALEVMRSGPVGPNGSAAVVLTLLVQAAALGALSTTRSGTALAVVALLASRQTVGWGCRRGVPAARSEGLGAAAAGSIGAPVLAVSTAVTLAVAVALGMAAAAPWYAGPAVVAVAVSTAVAVHTRATARFGGITGDVLGAGLEFAFAAALVCAVVVT